VDGQAGFMIDQRCANLIKGFRGGYHYRRLQVSGAARHEERPDKNKFSHIHDALQYALCGGGEGRALTTGRTDTRPVNARSAFDIFRRPSALRSKSF